MRETGVFAAAPISLTQHKQPLPRVAREIPLNRSIASILQSKVSLRGFENEDAFYVTDLNDVIQQHKQWTRLMPRVKPFYAVKCNPDLTVIKTLAECGTGFDCASKAEIQMVLEAGVDSNRIIYANPCKQSSHLAYATEKNIHTMTFDNVDELYKIKSINPNAKLVLRILTDDSKSVCRFGVKFGASLAVVPNLLQAAKSLNMQVIGVSFHVGSGCFDASSFVEAVRLARKAFDIGSTFGYDFQLLDIGGGFPGRTDRGLQFKDIAHVLGPAIDELFPASVNVIAEPGRYFVSSAYTLAVNIVARRVIPRDVNLDGASNPQDEHPSYMYYINDGMYGSFNCITFDHALCTPKPLYRSGQFLYGDNVSVDGDTEVQQYQCSVWGPTCDSIDLIGTDFSLPEMKIGDWLVFKEMGAYTNAAASNFNGFKKSEIIYTFAP